MSKRDYAKFVGQKFGELLILSFGEPKTQPSGQTKKTFLCHCDCGATKEIVCYNIIHGKSKSCGHSQFVGLDENRASHNMSKTRPYRVWSQMIQRCTNPLNINYKNYGGRGITVCEKWRTFEGFWEDVENIYDDDLSIDRIDVNGDYKIENVTFSNRDFQSYNKRPTEGVSGKTGVTFDKRNNKWIARIKKDGKRVSVAYCDYLIDAIFARMQAEQEVYGFCKN